MPSEPTSFVAGFLPLLSCLFPLTLRIWILWTCTLYNYTVTACTRHETSSKLGKKAIPEGTVCYFYWMAIVFTYFSILAVATPEFTVQSCNGLSLCQLAPSSPVFSRWFGCECLSIYSSLTAAFICTSKEFFVFQLLVFLPDKHTILKERKDVERRAGVLLL